MKFTKTALTLALVAASGSAMAEIVDNPIDGTPVEAPLLGDQTTAEQKVAFFNKMMMSSGKMVHADIIDGEAVYYWDNGTVIENPAKIVEQIEDAAKKNKTQRQANRSERTEQRRLDRERDLIDPIDVIIEPIPGVEPTPQIGVSDQAKRHFLNKHLDGREHVVNIPGNDGVENGTISDMYITKDGVLKFNVTTESGEGQKVVREVNYQMTGEHAKEITKDLISKAPGVDPKLPPSIGPVEPGNPDNGPGIEDPVGPINGGEARAAYDSLVEAGQDLNEAGQSAYTTMNEIYDLGNQNAQDIETLFGEVDRLDERIDGVMASAQAVTAARPYLSTNQTNSVGVGVGYAGDVAAVAVGYAHRINQSWTANANVSATTGNDVDVSAGAGVSYAW